MYSSKAFLKASVDSKFCGIQKFGFHNTEDVFGHCVVKTVSFVGLALYNTMFFKPSTVTVMLILPA